MSNQYFVHCGGDPQTQTRTLHAKTIRSFDSIKRNLILSLEQPFDYLSCKVYNHSEKKNISKFIIQITIIFGFAKTLLFSVVNVHLFAFNSFQLIHIFVLVFSLYFQLILNEMLVDN